MESEESCCRQNSECEISGIGLARVSNKLATQGTLKQPTNIQMLHIQYVNMYSSYNPHCWSEEQATFDIGQGKILVKKGNSEILSMFIRWAVTSCLPILAKTLAQAKSITLCHAIKTGSGITPTTSKPQADVMISTQTFKPQFSCQE